MRVLFIVIIALLIAFSMFYLAHSKEECDKKGGTLVRSIYTGTYKCVREVK